MKKLLTLLGSVAVAATGASSVVSCSFADYPTQQLISLKYKENATDKDGHSKGVELPFYSTSGALGIDDLTAKKHGVRYITFDYDFVIANADVKGNNQLISVSGDKVTDDTKIIYTDKKQTIKWTINYSNYVTLDNFNGKKSNKFMVKSRQNTDKEGKSYSTNKILFQISKAGELQGCLWWEDMTNKATERNGGSFSVKGIHFFDKNKKQIDLSKWVKR